MALTTTADRSSWIEAIGYRNGYLAIFTKSGAAILYANVPGTVPGLLVAKQAHAKLTGEDSLGATYSRLVRGKYESQTVEDAAKVRELKSICAG